MKSCAIASLVAAAIAAFLFTDCRAGGTCLPGTTRCAEHVAEICSADGLYHELVDCARVSEQSGAPFVCAFVRVNTDEGLVAGHTCLPAASAGVEDGGGR